MRSDDFERGAEKVASGAKKYGLAAVFAIAAGTLAMGSFFTTTDAERHVVTHLSEFSHVSDPGLNFKIPFIQGTKAYPIDIQEFQVGPKNIASKGNQSLQDVVVKFQYRVPVEKIEWLHKNAPNYHDRARTLGVKVANEVLGTTDTTNLAERRTQVGQEMLIAMQQIMDTNGMGLEIQNATLENFDWDPAFRESIKENARVKNEIVRLEAELKRDEVEARRKVVEAQGVANERRERAAGEADAARTAAEGARDAAIAQADGEAYRVTKEGEARASAFAAEINAFGNPDTYVDYTEAKQWNGQLPTIMSGSEGNEMFIDLRSGDTVKDATGPAAAAPQP